MHHFRSVIRLCTAGLLLASACADVEEETNLADHPIAEVTRADGLTVSFYEPSPGAIYISQSARVGVAPVADQSLSPVALYASLAPGKPVPAALLEAQDREDAALAELGVAPRSKEAPKTESSVTSTGVSSYIDNQSCDDAWFSPNFCNGSYDWTLCLLNHWNGAYASSSSVDQARYATCADIGDITLKITMGDGTGGNWTVLEGQYRSWSWSTPWINESTRGDILNASNNRFHFSARYIY